MFQSGRTSVDHWKYSELPVKEKFETQLAREKIMLTIFWDSKGRISEDYLEEEEYNQQCKILCFASQQPKASNSHKTLGLLSKKVLLLHDNACHIRLEKLLKPLINLALKC